MAYRVLFDLIRSGFPIRVFTFFGLRFSAGPRDTAPRQRPKPAPYRLKPLRSASARPSLDSSPAADRRRTSPAAAQVPRR